MTCSACIGDNDDMTACGDAELGFKETSAKLGEMWAALSNAQKEVSHGLAEIDIHATFPPNSVVPLCNPDIGYGARLVTSCHFPRLTIHLHYPYIESVWRT